ncbi:MAG: hypothetical protein ACI92W_001004, partial [Paraglaciecola sp.]
MKNESLTEQNAQVLTDTVGISSVDYSGAIQELSETASSLSLGLSDTLLTANNIWMMLATALV